FVLPPKLTATFARSIVTATPTRGQVRFIVPTSSTFFHARLSPAKLSGTRRADDRVRYGGSLPLGPPRRGTGVVAVPGGSGPRVGAGNPRAADSRCGTQLARGVPGQRSRPGVAPVRWPSRYG